MENPFEHLQQQRQALENEGRQQLEAQRAAARREEEARQAQLSAAALCDVMVMRVLTQLQKAAYPSSQVRNHRAAADGLCDTLRGKPAWSVGHTDAYWVTDSRQEQAWYTDVVVQVEFDAAHRPTAFVCCRTGGFCVRTRLGRRHVEPHVQCRLAEDALVEALNGLYPATELRPPGWLGSCVAPGQWLNGQGVARGAASPQ